MSDLESAVLEVFPGKNLPAGDIGSLNGDQSHRFDQYPTDKSQYPAVNPNVSNVLLTNVTDVTKNIWTLGDELPKERPSLVSRLLPAKGLVFLGGQSGAGKSYIAVHLSVALASGESFFGLEIPKVGGTIYLALEGGDTIAPRLVAARIGLGLPDKHYPIALVTDNVGDLSDPASLEQLIRRIVAIAEEMLKRFNLPVRLVIVDTLAAAFSIKDENSAADMTRVCKMVAKIGDCINAVTLAIHHYGKASGSGLRGSSSSRAAAEGVISIIADRDELTGSCVDRRLVLTKSRYGAEGATYPFDLEEVNIRPDRILPVMVARVVSIDEEAEELPKRSNKKQRNNRGLKCLKNALEQALIDYGKERRIFADGPLVKAVDLEQVRKVFYPNYRVEGNDNKASAARRQAFGRACNLAEDLGLAKCYEVNGIQLIWQLQWS